MKKNVYQAPEMEVVELKSKTVLLAGSEIGGGGGGGFGSRELEFIEEN